MRNLDHLTLANLIWIRDVAYPKSKLRINSEHLDIVLKAKALIYNSTAEQVGCFSCNSRAYFKTAASVLDQYYPAILEKIAELETAEFSQILYYVDNNTEVGETDVNNTLDSTNSTLEFEDDIVVEKIVNMESTENEISVTTVKRGRKKNEE
jgi:hypothetical protein